TESTRDVLTSVWQSQGDPAATLDDECSPTKVCRNMQGIDFSGFAEGDTDIRDAWRNRLAREGKLSESGQSIRDLVLGSDER
ncbi:MAG: hypothetical protein ACPHGX_08495, partial [Ilumatobacteraceae bacterium]